MLAQYACAAHVGCVQHGHRGSHTRRRTPRDARVGRGVDDWGVAASTTRNDEPDDHCSTGSTVPRARGIWQSDDTLPPSQEPDQRDRASAGSRQREHSFVGENAMSVADKVSRRRGESQRPGDPEVVGIGWCS